ncbi:MAG TPA: hypothetical protein VFX92_00590 [Candidatus Krumholzibacteria bacterium]|nr:hypothetical protein [Candidatus Krumholzibacteria bacterium]
MVRKTVSTSVLGLVLIAGIALSVRNVDSSDHKSVVDTNLGLSPMGRIARGDEPMPTADPASGLPLPNAPIQSILSAGTGDKLTHSPVAPDFQSETTIAKNGDWIVVGYNDYRGFLLPTTSVSGYAYSHDDGATWTDGGQLPTLGGDAVFGDPDVKTWSDGNGTRYFVFSSIYQLTNGNASLCVHVSTDGGVSWTGPRIVTPATSSTNFADKEFIDIDPETGRVFVSWTNFPNAGSTTMRTAYSDDFGVTWSAATIFASSGQGSVPRAAGNSDNVYIVWTTGSSMVFVRSLNNGVSWSSPASVATGLSSPMNPYGSDRIGNHPSLDVDPVSGNVYLVFASRNLSPDFGDVYFMRSTDGGVSFSPKVAINSSPGSDRVQFFPSVCADEADGSVGVIWYDQRVGTGTSDLTELVHTHSPDGGVNWTCPAALSDQPFHAESGNTTSQPNIGDYIQGVSVNGSLYTCFGKTDAPSWTTYSPDAYVDVSVGTDPGPAPLALDGFSINDTGCTSNNGYIEPGETIDITFTLRNIGGCGGVGNVVATLSTTTPGITINTANATFPNLPALGSTSTNSPAFQFTVDPGFVCGSTIDFVIEYVADLFGAGTLPFDGIRVGHPVATVLLSENFDAPTAPALPAGWTTSTVSGAANPWQTSTTFAASGANAAFCADLGSTSQNELKSPTLVIPAGTDLVIVDLDETHNMEVNTERQAWDGGLMRILLGGKKYMSGALGVMDPFYPWQMLRQASADQALQDLACWSDDTTPNFAHYKVEMPDLDGQSINLLFAVSTDPVVGTATGQFIDNVVVTAVDYECDCGDPTPVGGPVPLAFDRVTVVPNPFNPETAIRFALPARTTVTASVYSVDGKLVRTLAKERAFNAGPAELRWNGLDDRGASVASGIYFVRVRTPEGEHIARAVLLK